MSNIAKRNANYKSSRTSSPLLHVPYCGSVVLSCSHIDQGMSRSIMCFGPGAWLMYDFLSSWKCRNESNPQIDFDGMFSSLEVWGARSDAIPEAAPAQRLPPSLSAVLFLWRLTHGSMTTPSWASVRSSRTISIAALIPRRRDYKCGALGCADSAPRTGHLESSNVPSKFVELKMLSLL